MKFQELITKIGINDILNQEALKRKPNIKIKGIANNSKEVQPGYVYIAIKGVADDGHNYVETAIKQGAIIIVIEKDCHSNIANFLFKNPKILCLEVTDTKDFLAKVSLAFYVINPIKVIAITGTNGKSSISFFVSQILRNLGYRTAVVGTLGVFFQDIKQDITSYTTLTSPDALFLAKIMYKAELAKVEFMIVEASSHGLVQQRLNALNIVAAGFSNLSRDHLNYHGTLEDYWLAKKRLFLELLSPNSSAVINSDDIYGAELIKDLITQNLQILDYGRKALTLKLINITIEEDSQTIEILYNGVTNKFSVNLIGEFQVYNVLCAILLVYSLKLVTLEEIFITLPLLRSIKGRLEYVTSYNDASIYVDYAHTPDALRELLKSLRAFCKGQLRLVFGCGGNRDVGKRFIMGEIARDFADIVYVTDDNPRDETPLIIREAILKAFLNSNKEYYSLGRAKAIKKAVADLQPQDILVIAGKGHETYQILANKKTISFDDTIVVKETVTSLGLTKK